MKAAVESARETHGSARMAASANPAYSPASPSTQLESVSPSTPETHTHLLFTPNTATNPPFGELFAWWFGGASDLTLSYLYEEDAVHVHSTFKSACDAQNPAIPCLQKWCDFDEHFHITHRGESRGLSLQDVCPPPAPHPTAHKPQTKSSPLSNPPRIRKVGHRYNV